MNEYYNFNNIDTLEPLVLTHLESSGDSQKELSSKLLTMLGGTPLNELPLDYIDTVFFGDLYEQKKLLGAGTFGIVIKVMEKSTQMHYAIKVFFYCFKPKKDNTNKK